MGRERVDNFYIYRHLHFEGEGGISWNIYINGSYSIWELKDPYLDSLVRYRIIKKKSIDKILCQ